VATDSEQRTSAQRRQREVATQATNSSLDESDGSEDSSGGIDLKVVGALAAVAGVALLAGGGYVYRDTIKDAISWFISVVDDWGPYGYVAYTFVYTALELIIIPAVPLTMASGVLFGVGPGTVVVSLASTAAAAIAFLITRYAARDKIAGLARDNKKFAAIDKAIGKDSFKVVLLLRLSPLLPLSLSNYLYGLTSVDFVPYVLGSWLGQLPGTFAYVSAGSYGRKVIDGADAGGGISSWQIAVGAAVTILAIGYIGRLAKQALDEVDDDLDTA
jgi:uncharacterized membrane protein YdjX (TVP38/TMEM64 family)